MTTMVDSRQRAAEGSRGPDSIRWSLGNVTRCGQAGYMRPCQVQNCAGVPDSSFPMSPLCETGAEAVFVVDDEPDLRSNLVELIESLGYRAIGCASAAELQERAPLFKSGCVLLDIKLPGLDGLAIQDWLNQAEIVLPVIFISGMNDVSTVVQGMKGGAIDFLQKPISEMGLRRSINTGVALSRKRHCNQESERLVRAMIDQLTPTELYVAQMISKGYPTKLIAAEMERSENTVKIHRHRIFNKLKVNSAASVANIMGHADVKRGK